MPGVQARINQIISNISKWGTGPAKAEGCREALQAAQEVIKKRAIMWGALQQQLYLLRAMELSGHFATSCTYRIGFWVVGGGEPTSLLAYNAYKKQILDEVNTAIDNAVEDFFNKVVEDGNKGRVDETKKLTVADTKEIFPFLESDFISHTTLDAAKIGVKSQFKNRVNKIFSCKDVAAAQRLLTDFFAGVSTHPRNPMVATILRHSDDETRSWLDQFQEVLEDSLPEGMRAERVAAVSTATGRRRVTAAAAASAAAAGGGAGDMGRPKF